jgi:photosystem II stability/assembly factor-like uncharacterized protein
MRTRSAFVFPLIAVTLAAPAPSHAQGRGGRGTAAPTGAAADTSKKDPLTSALGGLRFRNIGPGVISGRILDLAVHPTDHNIWYLATVGGVWKTTNAGSTFSPIFDDQGSYSIGTVVIDQKNPNVVWVGSGENNAQRSVAYGDGVYKSVDGGKSWTNMGLKQSEHIASILIDPRNSNVVYVAAQGPVFNSGGDRGLFKTTDGGKTWNKVLDGGTWAGVASAVMDPRNPDVIIASVWQRARRQWGFIAGGPQSSLQRSTDGGATWTKVSGMPGEELGRIGLAISPANPDVVYAVVEAANDKGGFYRSRDNGASFDRMGDLWTTGNYYNEVFADPVNVNRVYAVDTRNMISDDGGRTFRVLGERNKHVDNHVIWIDPANTDHLLLGCDGGLYQSWDGGQTYDWFQNLPMGQFYRVETDNHAPFYRVYGGTQDNSSVGGPSRTRTTAGGANSDWFLTQGGDGFVSRVDPSDPNTVYAEYQNGGLARFNLLTGEQVAIVPEPEPGEPGLRWHWDAPVIISPFSHTRLYFGAQRLFRSDDRGNAWRPVSPDLTRQIDRNKLKLMDRVWGVDAVGKNTSTSFWGAITSAYESPLKEGLLWVGTDDGLIQVSEDGGTTWRKIGPIAGIPDTTFVTRALPSAFDTNTVYATFDNHKTGDYKPYVAKSTDLGRSWTVITNNLPERGTVYALAEDTKDKNLLFVGTEFGLYVSNTGGKSWTRFKGGLPNIQVRDITVQKRDDDLVIASFGRGFYVLDDLASLRSLSADVIASTAALLPVRRAPLYIASGPDPDWQGARFYNAANPPFGATFTYYLKDAIKTRKELRQEAEKAAGKNGGDVQYPNWDSLRVEEREEAPAIILTVTDAEGRVVRRITGPVTAGTHRVTWNLRYPAANPVTSATGGGGGGGGFFGGGNDGPFAVPGSYTVSMAKRVEGVTTPIGAPQRFDVYPLDESPTPRTAQVLAFEQKAQALQRAVLGANAAANEAQSRITLLKRALNETASAAAQQVMAQVAALSDSLRAVQDSLGGDQTRGRHSEASPPSLLARLGDFSGGDTWSGALGGAATGLTQRQYDIVAGRFPAILARLHQLIDVNLKRAEDAAEAAGAPWTTGRVPNWR